MGEPGIAKQELQRRISKLVLTPRETSNGWVIEVSGDVALFVQPESDVMLANSREGIAQHYMDAAFPLRGITLDPFLPITA
jgi:hypothetical protein